MEFADVWFTTLQLCGFDANGEPIIKFIRERVFKVGKDVVWQYQFTKALLLQCI